MEQSFHENCLFSILQTGKIDKIVCYNNACILQSYFTHNQNAAAPTESLRSILYAHHL